MKEPYAPRGKRLVRPIKGESWDSATERQPSPKPQIVYLVGYDLNNERNYVAIETQLAAFATRQRILNSQWLLQTDLTVAQLAELFGAGLDPDDSLFITEVTKRTVWQNLLIGEEDICNWMAAARD